MIKAIALDDEPPALEIIETFAKRMDSVLIERVFTSTGEAFSYLNKNFVDLLFLDIRMPAVSGIDFYTSLPQKLMVIFTTSYSEYAVESYNLNAVDYLLKPFTYKRFEQAVSKAGELHAMMQANKASSSYIMLKADYSLVKVALADIVFVEGLDNYLKIHLQDQKPVIVRMTMKALLEKLPQDHFIRVHRSFIVPLKRIEAVRNKMIIIQNEEVPIGNSYEENFFSRFRH